MSLHLSRSQHDRSPGTTPGATHEAWFYRHQDDLIERSRDFVLTGLDADEAVCVILPAAHLEPLRAELGDAAAAVTWAEMDTVGRNPGRLIGTWCDLIGRAGPGRTVRGIGEPAYPGRRADELVECRQHEVLLDTVLAGTGAWIACPYDERQLPDDVLAAAQASHPASGIAPEELLGEPLAPPPLHHAVLRFGANDLGNVRRFVRSHTSASACSTQRIEELVLAINELAANSIRHGGGSGALRSWTDAAGPVFEVQDAGAILDPMVGRRCPPPDGTGGRGLWMVHHLCDLVQVRSGPAGTTIRVRMHPEPTSVD